jgi:hypothetical protein
MLRSVIQTIGVVLKVKLPLYYFIIELSYIKCFWRRFDRLSLAKSGQRERESRTKIEIYDC